MRVHNNSCIQTDQFLVSVYQYKPKTRVRVHIEKQLKDMPEIEVTLSDPINGHERTFKLSEMK